MESLRKLGLLDTDGKPVEDRLSKILNALLPRFRRRFPAIQDDVEVTEVFEEAARRITKRERASGPIEKLGGYAWKALESIGVSLQRRGSMQVRSIWRFCFATSSTCRGKSAIAKRKCRSNSRSSANRASRRASW